MNGVSSAPASQRSLPSSQKSLTPSPTSQSRRWLWIFFPVGFVLVFQSGRWLGAVESATADISSALSQESLVGFAPLIAQSTMRRSDDDILPASSEKDPEEPEEDEVKNPLRLQSNDVQPHALFQAWASVNDTIVLQPMERKMILVHVGKAGGTSFRRKVAICHEFNKGGPERIKEKEKACMEKHYEIAKTTKTKLNLMIEYVIHVFDILRKHPKTIMKEATGFVFTIRNPVDRIISSFRYSHPDNCPDWSSSNKQLNRGCHIKREGLLENKRHMATKIFTMCFPGAGVEEFAQSVLNPWDRNATYAQTLWQLHGEKRRRCRQTARQIVQGRYTGGAIPHFHYNYYYYVWHTIYRYPEKEVFAIRTENEWDDIIKLDQLVGGSGLYYQEAKRENYKKTHGSENYKEAPVSTEAYHKLCCVLNTEIAVYMDILNKAMNLNAAEKAESLADLFKKCGIISGDRENTPHDMTTSWFRWKTNCERRVQEHEWAEMRDPWETGRAD